MPVRDPVTNQLVGAPPGGWTISGMGGYIAVRVFGDPPGDLGSRAKRIDVTRWTLTTQRVLADITNSGSLGAISRRIVALDWTVVTESPWEFPFTPEQLLRNAAGGWDGGNELVLRLGAAASYPAGSQPRYYYAPSGFLESVDVIDSSAGDDVIRYSLTFRGNSRIFLLPDQLSECRQYMAALEEMGYSF